MAEINTLYVDKQALAYQVEQQFLAARDAEPNTEYAKALLGTARFLKLILNELERGVLIEKYTSPPLANT